jgi:hypothetical protein
VRSVTTISMMFMMTMPPTTRESPTTPTRTATMPSVARRQMPMIVPELKIPKSFSRPAAAVG